MFCERNLGNTRRAVDWNIPMGINVIDSFYFLNRTEWPRWQSLSLSYIASALRLDEKLESSCHEDVAMVAHHRAPGTSQSDSPAVCLDNMRVGGEGGSTKRILYCCTAVVQQQFGRREATFQKREIKHCVK